MSSSHNLGLEQSVIVRRSDGTIRDMYSSSTFNGECFLQLDVKNEQGDLVNQKTVPMHSFVKNFLYYLATRTLETTENLDRKGTGTADAISKSVNMSLPATTESTHGIIIGTDDGSSLSMALDNYDLGTHVTTNWAHSTMSYVAPYENGGFNVSKVSRSFTNQTGGSVTIEEVGLVVQFSSYYYLLARDLLGVDAISVDDGEILTVNYLFKSDNTGLNINFWKAWYCQLSENSSLTFTDVDGDSSYLTNVYSYRHYQAYYPGYLTQVGIMLGTDDTALSLSSTQLGTLIADGSGAGQLIHGDTTYTVPTTVGSSSYYSFHRSFTNNSGGAIVVKEAGWYAAGGATWTGYVSVRSQIARTLLNGLTGVTVGNGESIDMSYTVKITV